MMDGVHAQTEDGEEIEMQIRMLQKKKRTTPLTDPTRMTLFTKTTTKIVPEVAVDATAKLILNRSPITAATVGETRLEIVKIEILIQDGTGATPHGTGKMPDDHVPTVTPVATAIGSSAAIERTASSLNLSLLIVKILIKKEKKETTKARENSPTTITTTATGNQKEIPFLLPYFPML